MKPVSALFFSFLLGPISWAGAKEIPRVNTSLSASFLPAHLRIADPVLRARLAGLLRNQPQDSTAWVVWEGDVLLISADLAVRLGAFSDTVGEFRARTRRALERISGSGIEEEGGLAAAVNAYYPNDSLFTYPQWALYNNGAIINYLQGTPGVDIGMTRVWGQFDGDDSLVIADVDAGINFLHPDLQGRWFRNMAEINGLPGVDDDHNGFVDDTAGWDFVNNDNYPQDYNGHGTLTSGLMAASFDNETGISGMIPRVRILPIRVLNTAGVGTLANIAAGIQYAVKNHVAMHVSAINFSISGGWASTNTAMRAAFQAAQDSGIPIIVAAGNNHLNLDSNPMTPSSYGFSTMYMVAGHTNVGPLVGYSNYGPNTVPIAAPADNIISTDIPPYITAFSDGFETGDSNWSFAADSDFILSTFDPLDGTTSLQWSAGTNTWAATKDSIDLTGKVGSSVNFMLTYKPASARDELIVEGQRQGGTTWTEFAVINSAVDSQSLAFDTHPMDGAPFKLRFRTLATGSVTGRILRLDDVHVHYVDLSPQDQGVYTLSGGTSLAAPYMTGYIALLRLACQRMNNVPAFTRALALAAAVPESSLTGKVGTGGRLDVSRGLNFYLSTLPNIAMVDSTHTSWTVGDTVNYALSVPGAAASAYAFKDITDINGSTLTTAGQFAFNSTGKTAATDTVRFMAEGEPLVLRKFVTFTLTPKPTGIQGISSPFSTETFLWVGERAFVLPASFFQNSRHLLNIERIEANGRIQTVFSGEVETPSTTGKISYQLPGLTGLEWRVRVDGVALAPRSMKSTP